MPHINKRYIYNLIDKPMVHGIFSNTIGGGVSRTFGSLIPIVIAWQFGVGAGTDKFFYAIAIIMFLTTVFSETMETVTVPFFTMFRRTGKDAGAFVGIIIVFVLIVMLIFISIGALTLEPILLYLTRYTVQDIAVIRELVLLIFPIFLFILFSSVLVGFLNSQEYFLFPSLSATLRSLLIVIAIVLGKNALGLLSLPVGYVIGELFRTIVLAYYSTKHCGLSIRISRSILPQVYQFFRNGSYHAASSLLGGLNPLVDKTLALWLGVGAISIIEYADRLNAFVTMIILGVFPVLLSRWSNAMQAPSYETLWPNIQSASKWLGGTALILTAIGSFFAYRLVTLVYMHGDFPPQSISLITTTFGAYIFGLVPYILSQVFVRAYLVLKVTRILMIASVIRVILNIYFDFIFIRWYGVVGIALSSTVCTLIQTIIIISPFMIAHRYSPAKNSFLGYWLFIVGLPVITRESSYCPTQGVN